MDHKEGEVSPKKPTLNMAEIFDGVVDYAGAEAALIEALQDLHRRGVTRIGFVSGPLGESSQYVSDEQGSAWKKSMDAMKEEVDEKSAEYNIVVFSSAHMFDGGRWEQLRESKLPKEEIHILSNELFGNILKSGLVSDIFMMEGWKNARGSVHEHDVAKNLGPDIIEIHKEDSPSEIGD